MDQICFFTNEKAKILMTSADSYQIESDGCGKYWLDGEVFRSWNEKPHSSSIDKLQWAAETIKLNDQHLTPYWGWWNISSLEGMPKKIILKSLKDYENLPIQHSQKSDAILRTLSEIQFHTPPFKWVHFEIKDIYRHKIAGKKEFLNWFIPLFERGLIQTTDEYAANLKNLNKGVEDYLFKYDCISLSPKGWELIEKSQTKSNSVFIAMAFTDNNKNEVSPDLRVAIKSACEELGWDAKSVNEEEHNDGIMDKVISQIKKSRFVIAELSYQKTGVYYEAGFAKGIGLDVIHVVSKADFDNCHFDVKHLNLIVWLDLIDLKIKLQNRIEATIGIYK